MEPQLTRAVRRAVQTNRDGIATRSDSGTLTWEAFADRVARLAAGLVALGVGPGDRVAMLAHNSERYLEYFFAVPWAGGVFVPVNTRLAAPEIAYWLNDSGAQTLLVDDVFHALVEDLAPLVPGLRRIVYADDGAAPEGTVHYDSLIAHARPVPDAGRGGDDLAGIFYTGGTTGVSKGVMLSHANLLANAMNVVPALGFDRETNWLHCAPMFHLADGTATFAVALTGGSHTFIPKFDASETLRAIEHHACTNTVLVPTMINLLVNHPEIGRYRLDSMRGILYGASPMPEALLLRAFEVMPGIRFYQGYGQTEAAPCMTVLGPEYHVVDGPLAGHLASVGQAVLGLDVAILDEADREVPRGTAGEICGRGPSVMLGYWDKPELTEQTLRSGWLHTGDGGYMDEDGFVYIVDRLKDMIISGGENVYSAEVENALYQHPAVLECAVIGVPDERWGERVHAIVRLHGDARADDAALIAHCHALIANYKCPRSVEIVAEPLPLSGAGKILKTELRRPYWAGHEKAVS